MSTPQRKGHFVHFVNCYIPRPRRVLATQEALDEQVSVGQTKQFPSYYRYSENICWLNNMPIKWLFITQIFYLFFKKTQRILFFESPSNQLWRISAWLSYLLLSQTLAENGYVVTQENKLVNDAGIQYNLLPNQIRGFFLDSEKAF